MKEEFLPLLGSGLATLVWATLKESFLAGWVAVFLLLGALAMTSGCAQVGL